MVTRTIPNTPPYDPQRQHHCCRTHISSERPPYDGKERLARVRRQKKVSVHGGIRNFRRLHGAVIPKDLSLSAGLLPAPCACADDRAVAAPSFRTRHGYKYEPEL